MKKVFGFLRSFVLFFVPHFVTDRVALALDEKGDLQVLCRECDLMPVDSTHIECYGTIRSLTWFGWASGGMCILDET